MSVQPHRLGRSGACRPCPAVDETEPQQIVGSPYADPTRAVTYSLGGAVLLAPVFGMGLIVGARGKQVGMALRVQF